MTGYELFRAGYLFTIGVLAALSTVTLGALIGMAVARGWAP